MTTNRLSLPLKASIVAIILTTVCLGALTTALLASGQDEPSAPTMSRDGAVFAVFRRLPIKITDLGKVGAEQVSYEDALAQLADEMGQEPEPPFALPPEAPVWIVRVTYFGGDSTALPCLDPGGTGEFDLDLIDNIGSFTTYLVSDDGVPVGYPANAGCHELGAFTNIDRALFEVAQELVNPTPYTDLQIQEMTYSEALTDLDDRGLPVPPAKIGVDDDAPVYLTTFKAPGPALSWFNLEREVIAEPPTPCLDWAFISLIEFDHPETNLHSTLPMHDVSRVSEGCPDVPQ